MSPQLAEQRILPCSHIHARPRRALRVMGSPPGANNEFKKQEFNVQWTL
jgi:hypothetical protein